MIREQTYEFNDWGDPGVGWVPTSQPTFDPTDGALWFHDLIEHPPFDDGRVEGEAFAMGVQTWLTGGVYSEIDDDILDEHAWRMMAVIRQAYQRGRYESRGSWGDELGLSDHVPWHVRMLARAAASQAPASCERAFREGWAFADRWYVRGLIRDIAVPLNRLAFDFRQRWYKIPHGSRIEIKAFMRQGRIEARDVTPPKDAVRGQTTAFNVLHSPYHCQTCGQPLAAATAEEYTEESDPIAETFGFLSHSDPCPTPPTPRP